MQWKRTQPAHYWRANAREHGRDIGQNEKKRTGGFGSYLVRRHNDACHQSECGARRHTCDIAQLTIQGLPCRSLKDRWRWHLDGSCLDAEIACIRCVALGESEQSLPDAPDEGVEEADLDSRAASRACAVDLEPWSRGRRMGRRI